MGIAVNKPTAIAGQGVSALFHVTAVPRPEVLFPSDGAVPLTINDAADLSSENAENAIFDAPVSALWSGMSILLGTTINGLTISSMPPGVAGVVELQ